MINENGIGGIVREVEAFEAFADIPQNRVLMAEKLTADTPVKPEIVEGLKNIDAVFEHYKPSMEVEFETEQGAPRKETMRFSGLGDFGVKGITLQSSLLGELTLKKEQYQKMIRQLKTNKLLKQALTDKKSKEGLTNALRALIAELEDANHK
jgi:hypothetical protein